MRNYFASFMTKEALEQFVKVGLVGIANTVVSFALFNVFLWMGWWSVIAVSAAFAITTFMSYLLNRAWTFEIKDGKVSGRETANFYLVNLAAWAWNGRDDVARRSALRPALDRRRQCGVPGHVDRDSAAEVRLLSGHRVREGDPREGEQRPSSCSADVSASFRYPGSSGSATHP